MDIEVAEFLSLRKHVPVVDVRSPSEFSAGHIPGAVNIPILNDEERRRVGIDYKNKGREEAIRTGFHLVGPRLSDIVDEAKRTAVDNEILVHCWRGGMRSANFCGFAETAGIKTHALSGGYKSYRHAAWDAFARPLPLIVLGGWTGSGKTELLHALAQRGEQIIDLEDLARHKGSVFGGLLMPAQPSTEQFQNDLYERLRQLDPQKRIWIEDESMAIGRIFQPRIFFDSLLAAPLIRLELSASKRVERLAAEYGAVPRADFLQAMERIAKRMGGQHYQAAVELLRADDFVAAVALLLPYYDKMYGKSLRRSGRDGLAFAWDELSSDQAADALITLATKRDLMILPRPTING